MKLTVFGATGRTGSLIVSEALRQGHQVSALVRNQAKMTWVHRDLRVIHGELTDYPAVESAVDGSEAVISALSSGGGTLATFSMSILPAMTARRVDRIVSLIGAGVTEAGDRSSLGRAVMLGLMNLLAKDNLEDARDHARQLRGSTMSWTLVRPPRLVDTPATGRIEHGEHLDLGPSRVISRADLAAFMLRLATGNEYVRASPMVANQK